MCAIQVGVGMQLVGRGKGNSGGSKKDKGTSVPRSNFGAGGVGVIAAQLNLIGLDPLDVGLSEKTPETKQENYVVDRDELHMADP
jgi:hypothetical protein